jgi:hypothetical protein
MSFRCGGRLYVVAHDECGGDRLSFLGRPVSAAFDLRTITVAPGAEQIYREADWRDSLVVVERGQIELECLSGGRRSFVPGNILWLAGMPLRAMHNSGPEPAVLSAVSRRTAGESP